MLVTRSKVSLELKVMVANTETKTVETITKVIGKVDEKKYQKELEKVLPSNLKFVAVEEVKEVNKLYGVPEAKFLDMAIELDPVTRKPLNPTDEVEVDTEEADTDEAE